MIISANSIMEQNMVNCWTELCSERYWYIYETDNLENLIETIQLNNISIMINQNNLTCNDEIILLFNDEKDNLNDKYNLFDSYNQELECYFNGHIDEVFSLKIKLYENIEDANYEAFVDNCSIITYRDNEWKIISQLELYKQFPKVTAEQLIIEIYKPTRIKKFLQSNDDILNYMKE